MKLEIKIVEGLNSLPFGCTTEEVRKTFGEPDGTEELDNPSDGSVESIVWNYDQLGLNFFFDASGMEPLLITIESENIDTEIFGSKIFQLTPQDIINLVTSNGYSEIEEDDETWGEHRVTFEEAQLDFYFADGDLTLVSWSSY